MTQKEEQTMIQAKFFPVFGKMVLQAAALAALAICAAPVYAAVFAAAAVRGLGAGFSAGLAA